MATQTSTRAGSRQPVKDDMAAGLVTVISVHSLTATPGTDTIQMVPVPAGARIVDVTVACTDIDTGTAVLLTVGDTDGTDDPDRYVTSSTIGQAGGMARLNNFAGVGYEFAADGTVDVVFTVAPTTFAAGTLTLTVSYTTDSAA